MDFISESTTMWMTGVAYDAVLVFCDRYTKAVKYIPTTEKPNADGLADLFTKHILNQVGSPSSLVSDQNACLS